MTASPSARFSRATRFVSASSLAVVVCVGLSVALAGQALAKHQREDAPRPNVVLIVVDDMGWGDPGAFGGTFVQTPRMDQIATEGMIFTQHYANAPVCSPTRAALFTGHYPREMGISRAIPPGSYRGLPGNLVTLPEMMRSAGYVTTHIGKWHLGQERPEYLPTAQGYDESRTHLLLEPQTYIDPRFLIDDAVEVQVPGHLTRITTDYALDFIDRHQDERFFASVWYFAPHAPLEPTAFWASQYPNTPNGRYAALISDVDDQIGEIMDRIDALGLGEDTLVLVASDNGSERPGIAANGPFRGAKSRVFEGGIRTPLFARWTGRIDPGLSNASPISTFDYMPTLASLLRIRTRGLGLEGQDFLQAFVANEQVAREAPLFWEVKDATSFFTPLDGELNRFAVRDGDWKLIRQRNDVNDEPFLYDLGSDPTETTDVAAANPAVVQSLLQKYRGWRARVGHINFEVAKIHGMVLGRNLHRHLVHRFLHRLFSWWGPENTFETHAFENRASGPYEFRSGVLELTRDPRFDFNDGDFSLRLRIDPANYPYEQVLAELAGSWRLSVLPGRILKLVVEGPSATTTLSGPLPSDSSEVAFTAFGWRFSESTVRLYIDGALASETNEIVEMKPNDGTIHLGNSEAQDLPYLGRMSDVHMYALSLTADEVAAAPGW